MKIRLIIFFLIALNGNLIAQTPYRNKDVINFSMLKKNVANAEKLPLTPKNKLILLNALKETSMAYQNARSYWADTSIIYINKWLSKAQEFKNIEHEGYAAAFKAFIYVKEKKGKIPAEELQSLKKTAFTTCEKLGTTCDYQPLIDLIYLHSYYEARDFKKYFEYSDKILQNLGENAMNDGWDFVRLRRLLTLAQYAEFREKNKQKTLDIYLKCLHFLENAKPINLLQFQVYSNWTAYSYLALGNFEKAIEYNKKALAYTEELIPYNPVSVYERWLLGSFTCQLDINMEAKDFDKAIELGKYIESRWGNEKIGFDYYNYKYTLAKANGNYKEALQAAEKIDTLKEKMFFTAEGMKSAELQKKYDYDRVKFESDKAVFLEKSKRIDAQNNAKLAVLKLSSEKELLEKKAKIAALQNLKIEEEKTNEQLQIKLLNKEATEQKNYRKNLTIGLGLLSFLALSLFMNIRNNRLNFKQKIAQSEAEFREKEATLYKNIAETEMTALRSQMNPHFIFNCLNSIKLYTLNNDAEMASEFLTKFSRLIRTVLDNSRSEKVMLSNELETLRLYIELEAMRFKNKVNYEINIDKEIDQQYLQIPPLLIQPYVENAIWHGLMHKKTGGKIIIDVTQPQEYLLHIEISDDGIGRALAAEYKSKSATKQKSFGLKMTSERISIINQLYNTNTVVEIIDLQDENNNATGTKVIIEIPL